MKKIIILGRLFFLAALFLAGLRCQADGAPKIPKQRENRFLFVVDTSSAMRGYSNEVVQGVVELLNSDMRGEFREGDTIGLWTYNDKLHPEFPMQVWSKASKNNIVADMAAFLRERRYAHQGRLDKAMAALNLVIKSSERITVVLIYDGTGAIQGTPFDRNINGLQKKYARELKLAHVPFITVLAARDGTVFDYTINYPGLVAIPHTANPEPVVTNAPVVAIANATDVPAKPRRTRPFIMSAATNEVPATTPALTLAVPAPVAPVIVQASLSQPPPAAVAPPPVAVVVSAPPQTQPVPAPVVARQNPVPANETTAPSSPPVNVAADSQQPSPAQAVAQTAPAAAIEPTADSQLALFVIAFSLLTIAVVLVVFLVRRSRHVAQSSLITQSIDRPR